MDGLSPERYSSEPLDSILHKERIVLREIDYNHKLAYFEITSDVCAKGSLLHTLQTHESTEEVTRASFTHMGLQDPSSTPPDQISSQSRAVMY